MFDFCETLEELKREYYKAAKAAHPDHGGSVEEMQRINAEYTRIYERVKNKHKAHDGRAYEKADPDGAPNVFIDLINALLSLPGLLIEVIGCFVWVSGNTKPLRDKLKALGLRWHSKREKWYKCPDGYKPTYAAYMTFDDIRDAFGVQYRAETSEEEKQQPRRAALIPA